MKDYKERNLKNIAETDREDYQSAWTEERFNWIRTISESKQDTEVIAQDQGDRRVSFLV